MNTPRTKASPTPNGKATDIPVIETEAESRILERLNMTPPIRAEARLDASACNKSSTKPRPNSPTLPIVNAARSDKSNTPIT